MKLNFRTILSLLLITLLVAPGLLFSQSYVSYSSDFKVEGTSTLDDWEMNSSEASLELGVQRGSIIVSITKLQLKLKAETLKSGKGAMDNNAYEALKTQDHPLITFEAEGAQTIIHIDNTYSVSIEGILTIAGTSKRV